MTTSFSKVVPTWRKWKRVSAEVEVEERETGGASFDSGETAEVRGLLHRASAAGIISAVAMHRISDGAEGELQRALGVGGDVVPWALMENRAAATFTANTGEATWAGSPGRRLPTP